MAFTSLEIIALIVIIIAAIKMVVLVVNPTAWMNFVKKLYSKPKLAKIVGLILAVVVLYNLIGAGITIVQILAVTAFVALLLLMALADEINYFVKKYQALIKKGNLWKTYWLYTLAWIILLVLGAIELFF